MTQFENQLLDVCTAIKNSEELDTGLMCNAYETAEEVVVCDNLELFAKEVARLKEVVKTNKPFVLNLAEEINEYHAWKELMQRAIKGEVVENLSGLQALNLLQMCFEYDDGVDIFIFENRKSLTVEQICQIYIAQTASFYYVFSDSDEHTFDGVILHLLS